MQLLRRLWNDEAGFIVTAEVTLIATIAVIGMIVGLATVRDQVVTEISDVAGAISDLSQEYVYLGVLGHSASTAGSDFNDRLDFCDADGQDVMGQGSACVEITSTGISDEEEEEIVSPIFGL